MASRMAGMDAHYMPPSNLEGTDDEGKALICCHHHLLFCLFQSPT